jgi:hypothetical protein
MDGRRSGWLRPSDIKCQRSQYRVFALCFYIAGTSVPFLAEAVSEQSLSNALMMGNLLHMSSFRFNAFRRASGRRRLAKTLRQRVGIFKGRRLGLVCSFGLRREPLGTTVPTLRWRESRVERLGALARRSERRDSSQREEFYRE